MASAHITIVSDSTNIFGIFEHQKCGEIGKPSIWGCIWAYLRITVCRHSLPLCLLHSIHSCSLLWLLVKRNYQKFLCLLVNVRKPDSHTHTQTWNLCGLCMFWFPQSIHAGGFPRPPWTLSLRLFPGPVSTTTLRPTWDSDAAGSVPGCAMLADLKCPRKQIWLVGIVPQQWTTLNITIFMGGNYRPQMVGLCHWVLAHYALCSEPAPNIYPHLTSSVLLCASRHSNGSRLRQWNNGSHRVFLVPWVTWVNWVSGILF